MELSGNYFEALPVEITSTILKLAELTSLASIAQVCSEWQRIINSKAYWTDYLACWENNCCVLNQVPDANAYLFPTRLERGVFVPDYKRYYFVRKNIDNLTEAIKDTSRRLVHNIPADSELTPENFQTLSNALEYSEINGKIAGLGFWFLGDFYKIFFERNDARYKSIIFPLAFEAFATSSNRITWSANFVHLANFIGQKDIETAIYLLGKACLSFKDVKEPNDRFSKAFRALIELQISLGRYCSVKEGSMTQFKFCIPTELPALDLIHASTPNADELHQVLCTVVADQFKSIDWKIQASALSMLIQCTTHDSDVVKTTAIRLGLEAIKSPHEIVQLHGYVALHSVLVMFENENSTADEILQLFDALSNAIDSQPKCFGLFFVEAILCLINEENSGLINDEKFNKLNNSIIELLLDSSSIDAQNKSLLISLCKLGSAFGTRLASFIPRYKHALVSVVLKRKLISSAELLDIYFRLGLKGVAGPEFTSEVPALLEEAEKGKEFVVDLPLLYGLIGDIIKQLLGWNFKANSQKILQYAVNFFQEGFALYGQSCISDMRDIQPNEGLPKLPETSDHSRRYFLQILKRIQSGHNLSNEDADEILEQTKDDADDIEDEEMSNEFIEAPSVFAADVLFAENVGESRLKWKVAKLNYKRIMVNLMKLTLEMKKDSFPFIQQIFHIALAWFRLKLPDERFIRPFAELIKLIAPLLTKRHLTYYLMLVTNNLSHYSRLFRRQSGLDSVEALYELFTVVFSLSIENKLVTAKIIRNLLDFSWNVDLAILKEEMEDFEHVSFLEYFSVLVTRLPNKTRTAFHFPIVDVSEDNMLEFSLRVLTILGYTYGIQYGGSGSTAIVFQQANLKELRDKCLPLISKFSPDLSYSLMKPFVVLLSCCMVDERIKEFIEMRRVFDYGIIQAAINSEQFDTGDAILNAEVKKLSGNPFALFAALKRK